MIVFRKRDQSANRRPPSLVDVSRAVTMGQGVRLSSFAAVAAPGPQWVRDFRPMRRIRRCDGISVRKG